MSFSAAVERETYPFLGLIKGVLRVAAFGINLGLKEAGLDELLLKNILLKMIL